MLVLTRKVGQRIVIDDNTTVELLAVNGTTIRLGITGPARVHREELLQRGEDHTAQQHDTVLPLCMPEETWQDADSSNPHQAIEDAVVAELRV